jgi:hypothetical protein
MSGSMGLNSPTNRGEQPTANCVFCGRPIGPDETMVGRPPSAAHAQCADAALTDDRHWDAIAAASGDADAAEEEPAQVQSTGARRAGCLSALPALLMSASALAMVRAWVSSRGKRSA